MSSSSKALRRDSIACRSITSQEAASLAEDGPPGVSPLPTRPELDAFLNRLAPCESSDAEICEGMRANGTGGAARLTAGAADTGGAAGEARDAGGGGGGAGGASAATGGGRDV